MAAIPSVVNQGREGSHGLDSHSQAHPAHLQLGSTPGHRLQPGIPGVSAAREAIPALLITPGACGSGSRGDVLFPQKLEALGVGFSQHRHDLELPPLTPDLHKHK